MTELLSFDDAMALAKQAGGPVRVLLGNGFSIGAHQQFQYGTLYERAKQAGLPEHVVELFERYGTTNFEQVLRQLDEGQWLAGHYQLEPTNPDRDMTADYEQLKQALVEAISASHPAVPDAVGRERLMACYRFLEAFSEVYTSNYDLLLYWTSLVQEPFRFEDGFGREVDTDEAYCVFLPTGSRQPHIYFVHGALHLTTVEGEVRKLVWNTTGIPIMEQVRTDLQAKHYPLVVSEGSPLDKVQRIESSSYLSWASRKFENIGGSLFTYGWALSEQDDHLLDAIAKNTSLERAFVGVYGDPDSEQNQALIHDAQKLVERRSEILASGRTGRRAKKGQLEVHFYDTGSANVWGPL
jgi:hypothetical protein